MEKYGINNVRGGSFCQIKLNEENKITIKKMIKSSRDKCYYCGKKGHYANKCYIKENTNYNSGDDKEYSDDEYYYTKNYKCYNCGKKGHYANKCPVKKYINNKKYYNDGCYRCGRYNHYICDCQAKTYYDGTPIDD